MNALFSAPLCLEIAWEVCNQLGGIYTVIRSKAPEMVRRWGDSYLLLGPYNEETAALEFEESAAPAPFDQVLLAIEGRGVTSSFGRWLIPGKPQVILFNYWPRLRSIDADKYALWHDNGIDCVDADYDTNQVIAFGFCVVEFLRELARVCSQKMVAHFHEWMAGVPLLRIAHEFLPLTSVFTTHATLLGRHVAGSNPHFYSELTNYDPEVTARRFNIRLRYVLERVAAQTADVFTTVSDVTGTEATHFLGRRPDVITPNGLNIERFAALHEFQNLHLQFKERIHEFVMGHFFPSYTFDLDRVLYVFISGRYEYRNKGFDVFIEALYRLNHRLKQLPNPPTVVAFLITKASTKSVNLTALQRHLSLEDLKSTCDQLEEDLKRRILVKVAKGSLPCYDDFLPQDFALRLKRTLHARKTDRLPTIVTHDLHDDGGDAILGHLRHRCLFNDPADAVKIIYHPDFLSATSPLLGLDYNEFVRGCHLGVFPSAYEPWGYTPPECLALGLPTVTTDVSGFGAYALKHIPNASSQGIFVVQRLGVSVDHTIEELTSYLFSFTQFTRRERIELRNKAERLSDYFDWSILARHYHEAHEEALRNSK